MVFDSSLFIGSMQAVFEQSGLENETAPPPTSSAFGAMANFLVPKLSAGFAGSLSHETSSNSADRSLGVRRRTLTNLMPT